ncbi:MAG: universal stress protein, partial [Haloarculaceae archaeon]
MQQVVVPVRYPLSERSKATLEEAIGIAEEREAALTVLHVNLYQDNHRVTRRQLREAVERSFGTIPNARYVVRRGLLVEETILE